MASRSKGVNYDLRFLIEGEFFADERRVGWLFSRTTDDARRMSVFLAADR